MPEINNDINKLESRIIELESHLAFLDQTLEELHQVLYRQQGQIDDLTAELVRLHHRLRQSDRETPEGYSRP